MHAHWGLSPGPPNVETTTHPIELCALSITSLHGRQGGSRDDSNQGPCASPCARVCVHAPMRACTPQARLHPCMRRSTDCLRPAAFIYGGPVVYFVAAALSAGWARMVLDQPCQAIFRWHESCVFPCNALTLASQDRARQLEPREPPRKGGRRTAAQTICWQHRRSKRGQTRANERTRE